MRTCADSRAFFACVLPQLIRSSQAFDVQMPTEDALKMKLMVDFQWACVRILAMSGAAGSPELFYEPHNDDDNSVGALLEKIH